MCTKMQLDNIARQMAQSYRSVYGNDVVVSPTVIPFDEFEEYKQTLPFYMNIRKEGKQIE